MASVTGIFLSWIPTEPCTLGSTQPLKNEYHWFPWVVKAAGAWGWRRTTLLVPNVKKSYPESVGETFTLRLLYVKTNTHLWQYLAQFFLLCEMFQTKVVEKIKTHILCSVTFFLKSCRLWDNVGKYCRAGQAAAGNMALHRKCAHCMLDD